MLNIFKKKKGAATIGATIEAIHNEFDTASDKLLAEAKDIISKANIEDADRLLKLGFNKAAVVERSAEAKRKQVLAKLIGHYQAFYPNNKFITEDLVKDICEKYGLVFGDASFYKGDIPEKNIQEMEAFKLRDEDKVKRTNIDDHFDRLRFRGLGQMIIGQRTPSYEDVPKEVRTYYTQRPFKICAPEKDFDMTYLTRKGYKLEYDPIVLQPVDGGYLIVTKWGMEGQDESLINEKQN